MELGKAGGQLLHYFNIGNPGIFDEVYAAIRSAALKALDERDAAAFEGDVNDAGGLDAYRRRQMDELAELLGVAGEPRPLLVFFRTNPLEKLGVLPIAPSALDTTRSKRALGRALCDKFSEEKLRTELGDRDLSSAKGKKRFRSYLVGAAEQIARELGLPPPLPADLTPEQGRDYEAGGYSHTDQFHISGTHRAGGRQVVTVNGEDIEMSVERFRLLLRLVVGLKSDPVGWVNYHDLIAENVIRKKSVCQSFNRLRDSLGPAVGGALSLIENNRAEEYRLSTHPDFVTYDKENLLRNTEERVRQLAEQLP